MFNQLMTVLMYLTTVVRDFVDNGVRHSSNVSGHVIHNVPSGAYETANAKPQKLPRLLSRPLRQLQQLFTPLQHLQRVQQQLVRPRRPVLT